MCAQQLFCGDILLTGKYHLADEGNYAGGWYWRMEGKPAGYGENSWPDYSPDAKVDFCNTSSVGDLATACIIPTVAQRNIASLGNTLLTADSSATAAASIAFNRFVNVQMAQGIAAVGDAIHKASDGKAFVTTLYGGFLNGPITAGGAMALTELNQQDGMDGIGNPSLYTADSRSDLGTMQPQGPWDSPGKRAGTSVNRFVHETIWKGRSIFSRATKNGPAFCECFVCTNKYTAKYWPSCPGVHGKTYVIEYDLRTYLTSCGVACYNFLSTAEETADLILHDLAAATIRGHALYFLDPKAGEFVDPLSNASDPGTSTAKLWASVQRAVQTAALYKGVGKALTAEVGVFVSDVSTAHWPVNLGADSCAHPPPTPTTTSSSRVNASSQGCYSWPGLILGQVGDTFGSLPFPVRYYLLSDLLVGDFSSLKLAILLNPIRVSDELEVAIKTKLQDRGKTILYVDAVATVDGQGKRTSAGRVQKLTGLAGLTKGSDSANQTRTTEFSDPGPVVSSGSVWPAAAQSVWKPLVGKTHGGRWPATPWWWYNVSSADASEDVLVLGRYEGATKLPSLVQVTFASHKAIYSANPALPTSAYLALAFSAGVHNYTAYGPHVRVEAGGNMLVIHNAFKGNGSEPDPLSSNMCDVALPKPMTVHAANGTLVCKTCVRFRDCGIGRRTRVYIVS